MFVELIKGVPKYIGDIYTFPNQLRPFANWFEKDLQLPNIKYTPNSLRHLSLYGFLFEN